MVINTYAQFSHGFTWPIKPVVIEVSNGKVFFKYGDGITEHVRVSFNHIQLRFEEHDAPPNRGLLAIVFNNDRCNPPKPIAELWADIQIALQEQKADVLVSPVQ